MPKEIVVTLIIIGMVLLLIFLVALAVDSKNKKRPISKDESIARDAAIADFSIDVDAGGD